MYYCNGGSEGDGGGDGDSDGDGDNPDSKGVKKEK